MIGIKIITGSLTVKSMTPNFVAVVKVLLPKCHIGSSMPFLLIFAVKTGPLLGALTVKCV